jgi:hypothetical protein
MLQVNFLRYEATSFVLGVTRTGGAGVDARLVTLLVEVSRYGDVPF